jgi:hypothetical protein
MKLESGFGGGKPQRGRLPKALLHGRQIPARAATKRAGHQGPEAPLSASPADGGKGFAPQAARKAKPARTSSQTVGSSAPARRGARVLKQPKAQRSLKPTTKPDLDVWLPARVVADLFGRCLRTLSNWDERGITKPTLFNGRRYYRRQDIEALLEAGHSSD